MTATSPARRVLLASAFLALFAGQNAFAASPSLDVLTKKAQGKGGAGDGERRNTVFSIGLSGMKMSLRAGDGNELNGNAGAVQIGAGIIGGSWYVQGSVDILLGPYEPSQGKDVDVDYVGTGATIWTGFSAQTLDLRSPEGGYGFALGLTYADAVGRQLKHPSRDVANEQQGLAPDTGRAIDGYEIRVTNLALIPGIFFSWLAPARPGGNTPELLKTRLEGAILQLGIAMPLINSYTARYQRADSDTSFTEKGRLTGYTLLTSLIAVIGT